MGDGFDTAVWGAEPEVGKPGSNAPSGAIIVIAATNRPEILDSALLRPGRFDRHIRVGLPSQEGRLAILQVHIKSRIVPLEDDVALEEIAEDTFAFSGADLSNVVNEACLLAVRASRDKVSVDDVQQAVVKVRHMISGE